MFRDCSAGEVREMSGWVFEILLRFLLTLVVVWVDFCGEVDCWGCKGKYVGEGINLRDDP